MSTLSVILVNYNNSLHTINCLKSLYHQSFSNFEIIIVENNSNNYNRKLLEDFIKRSNFDEEFKKKIKIIYSNKNTGFAGGNNLGYSYSKGDLILMLNSDTVHDSSFFNSMINKFREFKYIDIAQPKICFYNQKHIIWCNGGKINKFAFNIFTLIDFMKENLNFLHERPFKIDYAAGTALFVRREIIEKIGFLDESYFMYCEESDFCYRAYQNGYKNIYCVPSVTIFHKVSTRFSKSFKKFYFRNRMIFCIKSFPIYLIIWQFIMQFIQLHYLTFNFRLKKLDYRFFFQSLKGTIIGIKVGFLARIRLLRLKQYELT